MKTLHRFLIVLAAPATLFLMPALPNGIAAQVGIRRTFTIARGQNDFKLDDFIPLCVGTLLLGDCKQLLQALTRG